MFLKLNKAMPFSRGLRKEILYVFISGGAALFIFYFLQPFSTGKLGTRLLIGFGLVSVVIASIYLIGTHYIYYKFWSDRKWTAGWEILHSLFFLVFVATGIMFYGFIAGLTPLTPGSILLYLFYTILLGLIPVTTRAILVRNWRLAAELKETKKLNEVLQLRKQAADVRMIAFRGSASSLLVSNHDLIFIEAAENYISLAWEDGKSVRKELIRMTMKEAIKLIDDPLIGFCHRSYIINLRKVDKIISEAGALSIRLKGVERLVPVSPTYKSYIKERVNYV
jgi:hypothetical protein